jgi:3-phenylpropionate/trans-cinnamate dioxygenase ferredoxin reductase component
MKGRPMLAHSSDVIPVEPRGPSSVVIVGAGAAGISVAENLRRKNYGGAITIVDAEAELPYDRPPLSKQVLDGSWDVERIRLLKGNRRDELAAEWKLGRRAVAIEQDRRVLLLDDGEAVPYDALVIATGVRPRTVSAGAIQGVHVLRTHQDAVALREALAHAARLVVIGGGFLGLEAAATARKLGIDVTVVEPQLHPLADRLGAGPASRLLALHRTRGVDVRTGVSLRAFHGRGSDSHAESLKLARVELSDGGFVEADVALVAIGCVPSVEWLEGTSVRVDNGIVCDEYCRAAPGIWAAGDIARWPHLGLGREMRVEHRANAAEQGRAVALDVLGLGAPFAPVPYFWTDHFDTKIQVCGYVPRDGDAEELVVPLGEDSFIVEYRRRSDQVLVGALLWNAAKHVPSYRRDLEPALTNRAPT